MIIPTSAKEKRELSIHEKMAKVMSGPDATPEQVEAVMMLHRSALEAYRKLGASLAMKHLRSATDAIECMGEAKKQGIL